MPFLVSSSRLELRRMVIRGWSAVLAYDVTEPEATVTLYLSVDNRIQFVILDITQVHRVAVRSGGPGWGLGLGDVTGWHRHKWQSPCSDDIHHARQRHLLLTIATEYIRKACLLGYIILRRFRQLDQVFLPQRIFPRNGERPAQNGDQLQCSLVELQNLWAIELQRIPFAADYRNSPFRNVLALEEDLHGVPCGIVVVILWWDSIHTLLLHAVLEPVEHFGGEKMPEGVDLLIVFGCFLTDCSALSNVVLHDFEKLSDNLQVLGTIKPLWLMRLDFLNDQVLTRSPIL